jgi:hypothetical protein
VRSINPTCLVVSQFCKVSEPHYADVDAPLHPPYQPFSKKVKSHAAAVALHFIHYNFARIHKTLRITPAMAALTMFGPTRRSHLWQTSTRARKTSRMVQRCMVRRNGASER